MKNKAEEIEQEVEETYKTKVKDLKLVDPRNIVVEEGFNVRQDMGDIEALANSIVSIGLQVPLKAKKIHGSEKWKLIDGHRRMEAIQYAMNQGYELKFVDVVPFVGNEEDQLLTMIATGTGQKALNDVEQAECIRRLVDFHFSVREIAPKIGKSVPHVYMLLEISKMPKIVKNAISDGKISTYAVTDIIKSVEDKDENVIKEKVLEAISHAQKNAVDGKVKKATSKNLDAPKFSPSKSLKSFRKVLETDEFTQDNPRVAVVKEFINLLDTKSVEEIIEYFKSFDSSENK